MKLVADSLKLDVHIPTDRQADGPTYSIIEMALQLQNIQLDLNVKPHITSSLTSCKNIV